ncbi:hypothetical protein VNO77_40701 [Canavalia gladiata]|uniref:Uncharacterized protein n=1 Tax=Canavalia gladiata TaxID=3824 RepID=A0AAN9JZ44_CANGL
MAGQPNLNKKKFYWFWGRSHGSCPGSLPRVVCAVLLFVIPFIITYLSLDSVLRLWMAWIHQWNRSCSNQIRYYLSIYIRKGYVFNIA